MIALTHALNPAVYSPGPEHTRRVDIGFIGSSYPAFIGDDEREVILRWFKRHGVDAGVICDLRSRNQTRNEWAAFLRDAKGTIGAEAGTYYLDREGALLRRAKAFVRDHPGATVEDVRRNVYADAAGTVSGKAISSRHFEPAGTKTCQILIRGHYNGVLIADEHYIAVEKDLANIADAVQRFKDASYRSTMVERTYEYVMDAHTYAHRVASLTSLLQAARPA
jgi:spore maturation protein CgeB